MILKSLLESRANPLENPNVPLGKGGTTFLDIVGGRRTAAGARVNENSAKTLSAYWAGVTLIASAVGSLPLKVYRRDGNNGRTEARDHPLWTILHDKPNPYMSAASFREAMQGNALNHGNAFAEIETNGAGQVTGLFPLNPRDVTPFLERNALFYEIELKNGNMVLAADRILHVRGPGDGIAGWSVLRHARESLGLALALEEYGARFFGNNSRPSGILTHPGRLKSEAATTLKESWEATQGGLRNAHRVAVLEEGVQWQQIGLSAEDSQFLESRAFQVVEVARWLNLPPHKLKDMERAHFNNIEEQNIEFVQDTLRPWLVRWEQEISADLLTESERRRGFFAEFSVEGLLRGDTERRAAFYQTQFNTGAITPNEIRSSENRNPVEGGDTVFVRADMLPMSQAIQLSPQERMAILHGPEPTEEPKAVETRTETRNSHTLRLDLRDSFRPLFTDAAVRMVNGELRNVRRAQERLLTESDRGQFRNWLDEYYRTEHPEWMRTALGSVFTSYADAIGRAAAGELDLDGTPTDVRTFTNEYMDVQINQYSRSSRIQLETVLDEAGEAADEAVEVRLNEWELGAAESNPRAERFAQWHINQLGNAVAKTVFVAGGITALRWLLVGDSCPYCRSLSGKVVGVSANFLDGGNEFQPDDADYPLTPKVNVGHPPAHQGCDCSIVPA